MIDLLDGFALRKGKYLLCDLQGGRYDGLETQIGTTWVDFVGCFDSFNLDTSLGMVRFSERMQLI